MSAGLRAWIEGVEPAGAPELEAMLEPLLGAAGRPLRFEGAERLGARVHRLRFREERASAGGGSLPSLVIKCLSLDRSHREQRALRVWLPHVGLGGLAPRLLAVAAGPRGDRVWHVYEDLGAGTLARLAAEPGAPREDAIHAVAERIAALHVRCAAEPLLADCRLAGQALGAGFFAASVGDALRCLAALRRAPGLPREREPLIERLLARLATLAGTSETRARAFAELTWPETLQHGDLWLTNVVLAPGPCVWLIDWERAGVGTAVYDLSTFLRRLAPRDRPGALDAYRERVERAGWRWPEPALLERVAESCELGRFASCLLWRTLSALELAREDEPLPEWLFDDLVEMERWFAARTPLLSEAREASAA